MFSDQPPIGSSDRWPVALPVSRLDIAVKIAFVMTVIWATLNILYTLKVIR